MAPNSALGRGQRLAVDIGTIPAVHDVSKRALNHHTGRVIAAQPGQFCMKAPMLADAREPRVATVFTKSGKDLRFTATRVSKPSTE